MKIFRKGFTLIELLIVIVIIGILSVGFAPTLLNAPKKARDGIRKGNLASIKDAIEAQALEKGVYPTTNNGLTCKTLNAYFAGTTYFQGGQIPKDPAPANSACPSNEGYLFANYDSAKCYVIGAKLEISGSGNSNVNNTSMGFCTDPTKLISGAASKDYYYVIVNY